MAEGKITDKESRVLKVERRKLYYEDRYAKSLENADQEHAYYRSEQYTQAEMDAATDEEGAVTKPMLTLNHIKPHINFLVGEQSANRYYFKVIPADNIPNETPITYEGQPITLDKLATRLTEELKKAEEENDGEYEITEMFKEAISGGGRSYIEVFVKLDESTYPYKKQVTFEQRGQKYCFADPDHKKYDLSDSKDHIKLTEYTKDDLKQMFEGQDKVIDELSYTEEELMKRSGDNDDNDLNYKDDPQSINNDGATNNDNLVLVEYYDYEWIVEYMLINNTGQPPIIISDKDSNDVREVNDKRAEASRMPGLMTKPYEYGMYKIKRKEWYVTSYVSGKLLDKTDNENQKRAKGKVLGRERLEVAGKPVSRLPFAEYGADVSSYIDEISYKYISATKDMISAQDLHNKTKSSALDHLLKSVNSGIVEEEGALLDPDNWEEFGSSPGFIGTIKKGMFDKWKLIQPESISQAHVWFSQDAAEEMRYITNINLQMRGQNETKESGKAKAIQIRQGEKGIHHYFDNLRRTKHVLCKIMLEYICAIKGVDYKQLKVVVDDAAESPTARYANWLETKELFESGALQSPYGDLVIDTMNFNNREEWKQRYMQYNDAMRMMKEMQMKQQAEQAAIQDAQKEGLIPKQRQAPQRQQ